MNEVPVIIRDQRPSMAAIGILLVIVLVMVLNRIHTAIHEIIPETEGSREAMGIETTRLVLLTTTNQTVTRLRFSINLNGQLTAFHKKNMNYKWPSPGQNQFPSQ